ncbi:ArsR/SmtB family transcription factor [Natrarchaeobius oligotrophus]|uniref:ArsR family transcriptional regulator n=1 Tax=Natrarchaeobius chitinivorans TaxID=1679083 RepID=A0A3N6LX42_NATCH|nr:winged helix-turn-helix domain-containing protein [Natrarchaeobius chitinivorans]RQG95298.1 ArsR family transcriptional regulator [Natrarchaeobius chitinivorans]
MSYDTEHVRNPGGAPERITGIPTFTELLANVDLASLYTDIYLSTATTGPELAETADVSKKTAYEYLRKLERAGLVSETGDSDGTRSYEATAFEMTFTVSDVEVSITPELVVVIAHADEFPVIERVLEERGLVTFALAYDLVVAHSEGNVTVRQLATLTDLSSGTAYDIVEAIYEIADLGDDDAGPTTYSPNDVADEPTDLLEELTDE